MKAHDAAAGSPLPAGQEPPAEDAAPVATTAERGSMRKRARRLTRLREVQLRELGALVVEMRRLGRENPELVGRKAADLVALDEELRGLRAALGEQETVAQVVAAGVAGACRRCATLMGRDDRFCPHCGLGVDEVYPPAAAGAVAQPEAVAVPPAAEPAAPAEPVAPAEPTAPAAAASEAVAAQAAAAATEAAAVETGAGEDGAEPSAAEDGAEPSVEGAPAHAAAPPPPPPPPPPPELTATAPRQP